LIFDTVRSRGRATLRIVRARPEGAPKGFRAGKPARYYDLATTAEYQGRIRVCVRYRRQTFGNASTVRLFQLTKKSWTDRTVSLGTRPQRVCGRSPSLGRYAIFARTPKRTTAANGTGRQSTGGARWRWPRNATAVPGQPASTSSGGR
jgi:hypothetical protein